MFAYSRPGSETWSRVRFCHIKEGEERLHPSFCRSHSRWERSPVPTPAPTPTGIFTCICDHFTEFQIKTIHPARGCIRRHMLAWTYISCQGPPLNFLLHHEDNGLCWACRRSGPTKQRLRTGKHNWGNPHPCSWRCCCKDTWGWRRERGEGGGEMWQYTSVRRRKLVISSLLTPVCRREAR